jgi:hypothetical protein
MIDITISIFVLFSAQPNGQSVVVCSSLDAIYVQQGSAVIVIFVAISPERLGCGKVISVIPTSFA